MRLGSGSPTLGLAADAHGGVGASAEVLRRRCREGPLQHNLQGVLVPMDESEERLVTFLRRSAIDGPPPSVATMPVVLKWRR